MNENQEIRARKRRSSEEVRRLIVEFEASGLRRSEFCRTRGLAPSTLRRRVKKHGSSEAAVKRCGRLVAVELSGKNPQSNPQTGCALEVVLHRGRRIGVRPEFDSVTLGRVVKVLEGL